jgi:hypothetical protein
MTEKNIERLSLDVTSDQEIRNRIAKGNPLIVSGATRNWGAMEKWGIKYFRDKFGDDLVAVSRGLFSRQETVTKLRSYLDWLRNPHATLPGLLVDSKRGLPVEAEQQELCSRMPYLMAWRAFQRHPELIADMDFMPEVATDWIPHLGSTLRSSVEKLLNRDYTSIYIGPAGTVSTLHQDYAGTHAWLAQIIGNKRVILFPPGDSRCLYDGAVDPECPDHSEYPKFKGATAHVGEIETGDVLFVPANWWHYVKSLTMSITVSHNYVNHVNVLNHLHRIMRSALSTVMPSSGGDA